MPVKVCCKYRELVILSLMTIYLVFCKSKAKYHTLQAPGKQGTGAVCEGMASWGFTYTFIQRLIYDKVPANGGGSNNQNP